MRQFRVTIDLFTDHDFVDTDTVRAGVLSAIVEGATVPGMVMDLVNVQEINKDITILGGAA